MEQKKETRATIERKIKNAIVFVPKDRETQSVFFSDKGLRLTATTDYAVIETGFHRHVFNAFNSAQGVSRPYLYTKRIIEIAFENEDDFKYSFSKLLEVLKAKEDQSEYNIVVYYEWWLQLIFSYLYSIDEAEAGSFLVYEAYLHHISRNGILLSEKTADMTNKQFVSEVAKSMNEFIEGIEERVIFPKLTDEERMKQEIDAIQQNEQEQSMEAQIQ